MMKLIGQTKLIQLINYQIVNNLFPRFLIIVGAKGSGRKEIADFIYRLYNSYNKAYVYTLPNNSVDTIRQMISDAYEIKTTTFFIIPDADNMSVSAKNALLKITEEPPNKAYFVMTLEDERNTLDTLLSRGAVYRMNLYTPAELKQCISDKKNESLYINTCDTPGDIKALEEQGADEFYKYVEKVIDNIALVSGANSFKIGEKLAFKGEQDKYDLRLFWKMFITVCCGKLKEDIVKYSKGICITSKYMQDLRLNGVNKQFTFDMWLLDIRREWMIEEDIIE